MDSATTIRSRRARLIDELHIARQRVAWLEQTLEQLDSENSVESARSDEIDEIRKKTMEQEEEQFCRSDRMIAVGMLTAGVVREISDLLASIISNLNCLSENLPGVMDLVHRYRSLAPRQPWSDAKATEDLASRADEKTLDKLLVCLKQSVDGARIMSEMVRGLSSFSSVEAKTLHEVDLNRAVLRAVAIVSGEIKHRARLTKRLREIPLIVSDERRICQVLVNALINAAHAIAEGNVSSNEILVSTRSNEKEVTVEIRDTGRGIETGHSPMIFEPFFMAEPADSGTGLGLFVCDRIVKSLNGRIEVDSTPGLGTAFSIHLPVCSE